MAGSGEHRLTDGRAVTVRVAGPRDVPAIARLFTGLSPDSFRSRFQSGLPKPAMVTSLASFGPAPGARCLVAVAADTGSRELAGEARYVSVGDRVAEMGLTVADGYQGDGLGRLLLSSLLERARDDGMERLRAVVSLANAPMLRLLEHYGWVMAEPTDGFGVACLEIAVSGGMPGWPAESGRRVLVERRGWRDDDLVRGLRSAGEVRVCAGPRQATGRPCPLLTSGRCRLAEQADLIVSLLPAGEEDCSAVLAAHRRRWPHRLATVPV